MNDNYQQRLDRYNKAVAEMMIYRPLFIQGYRLALPVRNKWLQTMQDGHDTSADQDDSTAVEALDEGSSLLMNFIMPRGQEWARYKSGKAANVGERVLMDAKLKDATETLMNCLERSQLYSEAILAIQDAFISTGLLKITETDDDTTPFVFEAIPMHEVAISSFRGRIQSVWRKIKCAARDIEALWPKANIPASINQYAIEEPERIIELVESTIFYPMNPANKKYIYRVSYLDEEIDILTINLDDSPWIPFRLSVAPGETWGTGPVRTALANIRKANMISNAELLHVSLNVEMPIAINTDVILNPETFQLNPGDVYQTNNPNVDPFKPINVTGNLQFSQLNLASIQQQIRDSLFANPMGPVDQQNQTATEVQIRDSNSIGRRNAMFGRVGNELVLPILNKATRILVKRKLLPNLKLNKKDVDIALDGMVADVEYDSALSLVQRQKDIAEISQFYQMIAGLFGAQGAIAGTFAEKLPAKLALLMPSCLDLAKQPADVLNTLGQMQQAQQQMQQAPQQQQQQQPQPQQPMQGLNGQ